MADFVGRRRLILRLKRADHDFSQNPPNPVPVIFTGTAYPGTYLRHYLDLILGIYLDRRHLAEHGLHRCAKAVWDRCRRYTTPYPRTRFRRLYRDRIDRRVYLP